MSSARAVASLLLLALGCSIETGGIGDRDGAVDAPEARDAARWDAAVDAASEGDAASAADATLDAGAPDDAGAEVDASTPAECKDGERRACGTDVGVCALGEQTCLGDAWGPCTGGRAPVAETCNGVDDDCDGTRDEDESGLCDGASKCLAFGTSHRCMFMACAGDPCCSSPAVDPCSSPYTCEHVAFSTMDCPPECAGQCGNCHMCVVP